MNVSMSIHGRSPLRGAWIEIQPAEKNDPGGRRSPLRGAWIEIPSAYVTFDGECESLPA